MDFDFTSETITLDETSILTIGGTGALELPSGTTAQEPGTAAAGALRWNTTQSWVEYYNGSIWQPFTSPSSAVTSFSGGTTGLTPSTATSGSVTLAGTLAVANGGTGLTSTPANGALDIGTGTGFTRTTLTAGSGIGITNGAGSITISNLASSINYVTVGATATTQATATALPYAYNVVNATNGGNAVILPTPSYTGQVCNIENRTNVSLNYYPQVGGQIENLGTNQPYGNAANGNTLFVALSSTQWYAYVSSYSNGAGISITPATQSNQYIFANTGVLSNIAGTGISVSGSTGNVTVSNTGVLSVASSGAGISASTTSGAVTLTNPNASVTTGITAAGTNQSTATLLSVGYNKVSTVASGTGVILPSNPVVGASVTVDNYGANTLEVYPQTGGTIGGLSANTPTSLLNGAAAITLVAISSTAWSVVDTTIVAGTGISVTNTGATTTISTSGVVTSVAGTANQILHNGVTTAQTGALTTSIAPNVILPGNISETIPSGTTAQRPATPTVAMTRYNTTEDIYDMYATIPGEATGYGAAQQILPVGFQKTQIYRKVRSWCDEFMFGSNASTVPNIRAYGDLGWSTTGTATGTNSLVTGITDHPGILSLGSPATTNGNMRLHMGATNTTLLITAPQVLYFAFLVRFPSLTGIGACTFGIGDDISSTQFGNNGVWFTFASSGTLGFFTKSGGTVAISGGTGAFTPAANTWYLCEANYNGTNWCGSVNGTLISVQSAGIGSPIPTTAVQPGVLIQASTASSVTVQIDYFSMITQELGNRY